MMGTVLLRPRRLPQRFNRRIQPNTRKLVQKRHQRQRQYAIQRWQRMLHRFERRFATLRGLLLRFAIVIVVGLIFLFIGLAMFSPLFQVREIRVSRTDQRIDVERIQRTLSPLFGEHMFFLSSQDVIDLLEEAVPDLAQAHISKQYPSTLALRIELDPIIARLKIEDPSLSEESGSGSRETADFLTEEGMYVIYRQNQMQAQTGAQLVTIVDFSAPPIPWTFIIDASMLEAMHEAELALREQFGLTVTGRTVYLRAREFHIKTSQYELWFDRRSTVAQQIQRYRVFLQTVGQKDVTQYVDLRPKDKIVYR